MDPRLVRYYNEELRHLREMGAEFARQFPKIASRLGMEGLEVTDPYVERLLEGFAFLAARIQLKIDAEFPRFTQRLLEILYPQFVQPIPSMLVAQVQPELGDAALAAGVTMPRGTVLTAQPGRAGATSCEFRTAHELRLWPLELTQAEYFTHAADLPLAALPAWRRYRAGLRLRLRATAGVDLSALALDALRVHCTGVDDLAFRLHALVCGHALGVLVLPARRAAGWHEAIDGECIRAAGFDDDEALLPQSLRGFEGYRLLQEYFAFPQRFLFFDVDGLGDALRRHGGDEVDVIVLLSKADPALQQAVDASALALHCVPAINLLERRCDRIQVTSEVSDFHVVPDRTRPMDFEVHSLLDVTGYGTGVQAEYKFLPFYQAFHTEPRHHGAYYALRRQPRLLSEHQQREGPRSSYLGTEVYLSLVDADEAPYPGELRQVGVRALCTNRDLPLLMPVGGARGDLTTSLAIPVKSIRIVKGPSRPQSAAREGDAPWRLVNQLSINHLSLVDVDEHQGAAALREMLRLHVPPGDTASLRQVDGLRSMTVTPVVRRLPFDGPITFGRGLELQLEIDDLAFEGASAYLLGCVLERFLARHVSLNGFVVMRVHSSGRGEILEGLPRCGARPIA
jgi:type VI secretion system protein ImpG